MGNGITRDAVLLRLSFGVFLAALALAFSGALLAAPSGGSGHWTTAAPMPIYRSEMAAAVLDGRIYVGGGLAGDTQFFTGTTTAFQYYDPASNTWANAAPMPAPLHHLGMAALGGRIYVTGGYDGEDFNVDVKAAWAYDPTTNAWSSIADMPFPRAAHASAAVGGLLYVVGGVGTGNTQLWTYDPATNAWDASRALLPTAREHLTAAEVGGKLYVIAGRWFPGGNLATVEEYDPAANAWTARASIPTARSGLTSSALNGRIHVTGGEDLGTSNTFPQHEVYDPATGTWATFPPLPTSRHGLPSAVLGGRWYVIGGGLLAGSQTYSSLTNIVEVWVPEGGTPTPTATSTATGTATSTPTRTVFVPTPIPTVPPTPIPCIVQFADVPPEHTFYPYARCLACRSIVEGYPCGGTGEPCNPNNDPYFRPNTLVTRGQIAKIVSESAGFTEVVPPGQWTFTDVPYASTFWEWVERLSGRGIIDGYPCGIDPNEPCDQLNRPYFRPGNGATRGQLTKIVSEAASFVDDVPPTQYTFADVQYGSTFWLYVERLLLNRPGAMGGYVCGGPGEPCDAQNRPYFRPNNPLTRGQTAKIVSSAFYPGCSIP
jgi:hypothetical protein